MSRPPFISYPDGWRCTVKVPSDRRWFWISRAREDYRYLREAGISREKARNIMWRTLALGRMSEAKRVDE